ncbi:MAG: GNAT family N-acetyltransferase [Absicoccus sp.]|uniref:GNAT family N-acetyltransferase n=1 Tax=Absicoccus sp. TaxID=2718527 RepID=UPI002A751A96|nr:GNAT family N-acetyltransferase [Absicoccus sp.]MDY3036301.1 GNAT family N-acetyltransferase [Absicoccus sp.]
MIKIIHEPDKNRVAAYDEKTCIGKCEYTVKDSIWQLIHTEVDPAYGGQGIARKLVAQVVQEARNRGVKIDPICSYAQKEFQRNPDYHDVDINFL